MGMPKRPRDANHLGKLIVDMAPVATPVPPSPPAAERLSASWKQIAISAGSGALVGYLALAVAPLLPGRANAAQPDPPLMIIVAEAGPDGAPVGCEGEFLTRSCRQRRTM
jgi:hypothetical protein